MIIKEAMLPDRCHCGPYRAGGRAALAVTAAAAVGSSGQQSHQTSPESRSTEGEAVTHTNDAGPAARVADHYTADYRCPDCTAETRVTLLDGVTVLDVWHDETCPTSCRHRSAMP